jgi:hypothetical protein
MCSCSGSCSCNSAIIPRGPIGPPGPTGPAGGTGPQGPAGITPDSEWKDLNGFSYYDGSIYEDDRPQVRKIGKTVHFKGLVIIPLAVDGSPSTIIPLADYSSFKSAEVFQGTSIAGGCLVNVNGSITFNQNVNTIPTSVIPDMSATPIDATYAKQNIIATRRIQTYTDPTVGAGSNGGAILNSVISVYVNQDGKIIVQTLKDIEAQVSPLNSTEGVNSLRFLTSKAIQGQRAVNQSIVNTGNTLHSSSVATTLPYDMPVEDSYFAFDCDGSLAENLGGFTFRLDGLIAFITK